MSWAVGETVVLQEVWRRRLWSARPVIVAADRFERLALWCPKGTVWMVPRTPSTRARPATHGGRLARCLELGDWVLTEHECDLSTLWLLEREAAHAVGVSWLAGGEHLGWYVNFQEPFRRRRRTLQTMDLVLDIVVGADRRWRWKDEDEFETVCTHRLIDDVRAREVRAEGERVVQRLEANAPPFSEPWPDWRPEPAWAPPTLPSGWDRLEPDGSDRVALD